MNPIIWLGSSKDDVRAFPDDARSDAGFQLDKVQRGSAPDDWKPMTTIGVGVREIRIREDSGAFRIIYIVKFTEAVYVLHAFRKTTQATRAHDIQLAKDRLKTIPR